ncbi:MAG: acyl carrier protein [Acidobacteria bacterium]|nr:acyl carrier protein [Acidobacteriota bacterium]
MLNESELRQELKTLIVQTLRFEGLTIDRLADDTPLFGEGLGLDSVDALELVVALEKAYGITIRSHEVDKSVFTSVDSLGRFVARSLVAANSGRPVNAQ